MTEATTPREGSGTPQEEVPIIYDGAETTCSFCRQDFLHGERVCRITCRHMCHSECWSNYMEQGSGHRECPNCRGAGSLIAVWDYIDASHITQMANGQMNGNEAPYRLHAGAEFHDLESSSSGVELDTIAHGTPRSDPEQVLAVSTSPTFHIQTRLLDGRPAIIIDSG